MAKKIEALIKFLIISTFFVPLVVIPSSFIFPFIVPKVILFRSLTLLILGCYVVLLIGNWKKYRIKLTSLNLVVLLFFLSFAFSTFIGIDWYRSFWDNHERMLGLFTLFHYIAYYFIISSVVREWRDWKWLLRLFVLAGSVVMIFGLWQKFVDPEVFLNRGAKRVSATLGNPIYFSGYGLFLFATGLISTIKEKEKIWRIILFVCAGLGFLGILAGGTRGTLVGLGGGVVTLFLSYAVALKNDKKLRTFFVAILILGVFFGCFMFSFRKTNFVKNIPGVGRLLNTSLMEGTGGTRVMAWGIAVDAWKEKPVFGWGPNNYYYAFNKYYRAEFLEYGWGETWFDNAHNIVMNTLAVQGTFGFLVYFSLFGVAVFSLWRAYYKYELNIHIVSIGTAFLVAHFIHNVFVFENPTSYLYFFFFLSFINGVTNSDLEEKKIDEKFSFSAPLVIVVSLIVLLFIYSTNINPAKANMATLDAIKVVSSGGDATEFYNKATAVPTPHIDDIRTDFARTSLTSIIQHLKNKKIEEAEKLFNLVYKELEKNRLLHPLDIRINFIQAQLVGVGVEIFQDQTLLFESEKILEDALLKSPKRQQIQFLLSAVKMQLGKIDEATALLVDSIDNDPKIVEGWWRLAVLSLDIGDIDTSKKVVEDALAAGIIFEGEQLKILVENGLIDISSSVQ